MLFVRARLEPTLKKKRKLFADYLLQIIWPDPNVATTKMPEIGNLAMNAVKETIFKYVITLQGEEKRSAIGVYSDLGLLNEDKRKLKSSYWWHRLEALVDIELIASETYIDLARPLVDDDHPLVGLYALKVVSKSLNENEVINMLRMLREWNYLRPDIVQEILDNFASRFPMALANSLQENRENPKFYDSMCIRSLSKCRISNVTSVLSQWTLPPIPESYRIEAIVALGAIGDDQIAPDLIALFDGASDQIAAEILATLGKILGNRFVQIPERLKHTPGPYVKRALLKLREEI